MLLKILYSDIESAIKSGESGMSRFLSRLSDKTDSHVLLDVIHLLNIELEDWWGERDHVNEKNYYLEDDVLDVMVEYTEKMEDQKEDIVFTANEVTELLKEINDKVADVLFKYRIS